DPRAERVACEHVVLGLRLVGAVCHGAGSPFGGLPWRPHPPRAPVRRWGHPAATGLRGPSVSDGVLRRDRGFVGTGGLLRGGEIGEGPIEPDRAYPDARHPILPAPRGHSLGEVPRGRRRP